MRKWAEAYTHEGEDRVKVAALDVSDETDGGLATMVELKKCYGAGGFYYWHTCEHDDAEGSCTMEEVA